MTQYFVKSNLNHNNVEYKKGDVIDNLSDTEALQLIRDGVLATEEVAANQSEPLAKVNEERIAIAKESTQPAVRRTFLDRGLSLISKRRDDTGEPSIDAGNESTTDLPTPKPGMHILSQEDLDNNPSLAEKGLKVGDEVELENDPSKDL